MESNRSSGQSVEILPPRTGRPNFGTITQRSNPRLKFSQRFAPRLRPHVETDSKIRPTPKATGWRLVLWKAIRAERVELQRLRIHHQ